jgi:beta-phosphoglucomutase-like phosphatase (HAD superfamily)
MTDKIKLLIFDMDGLMIDTERLSKQCWQEIGRKYGYTFPQSVFDRIIGMDNRRIADVFRHELGDDFPYDTLYQEKLVLAKERIDTLGVPVKAGLSVCLDYAGSHHLTCAVASSTPGPRVRDYLDRIGVAGAFSFVQSGEDIRWGKPYPDIFLTVCQKLDVRPQEAVVLEDSANGLKAAAAAGIRSIWIPDICVVPPDVAATVWKQGRTLDDIPDMLEGFV